MFIALLHPVYDKAIDRGLYSRVSFILLRMSRCNVTNATIQCWATEAVKWVNLNATRDFLDISAFYFHC